MTTLIKGWCTITTHSDPRDLAGAIRNRELVRRADRAERRAELLKILDRVKQGPRSDDDAEWREAVEKVSDALLGRNR